MFFSHFSKWQKFDITSCMKKNLILVLITLTNCLFAQEKPGPFISRLISYPSPVLIFNFQSTVKEMPIHKINDLHPSFKFSGQALSKNPNGLFLTPLGTGRIYQWSGNEKMGKWRRIDSTYFTGYNYLSLFFSIDTTIYSFGGIGFWHSNGNLRKYNKTANEWNIKRSDKSIPWIYSTNQLFYIDTLEKKLYFNGQGLFFDAGLTQGKLDSSNLGKLYCLDIEKGRLNELGIYEIESTGFFGQTPWGAIISFDKLADYKNNKLYNLSENVKDRLYKLLANSRSNDFIWHYSFWLDSALYFTCNDQKYDSVVIHKSDLIPTNQPIYISPSGTISKNKSIQIPSSWVSIIIFALLSVFILYGKYLKRNFNKILSQNIYNKQDNKTFVNERFKFNEVELNLIRIIFENSILRKMTSINEINNILGCANKNIEIQKRLRSDSINTINQKFCMNLLIDYKIIERKRTDFDGRSFEYYIDEKHLQQVSKLLA
jgi:hypothetical protein